MVLLIADEYLEEGKLKLTEIVTGTATAKETPGSRVYLDDGEKMTLDDILKSISIPSANDAAVALAEHIAGSEEAFVQLMNKRAQKLGLKDTHYVTASGLDAEGHYSTARDIAKISREVLLNHPRIMAHSATVSDTLRDGTFPLINTNNLLSNYQYATGLKTGTTDGAGYCLTATAQKDNVKLICVILGAPDSPTRFSEAKYLFEYTYSSFTPEIIQKKGILKDTEGNTIYVNVQRGNKSKVALFCDKDITAFIPSSKKSLVRAEYEIDNSLVAPVPKGSVVGKVNIYVDNVLVSTTQAKTSVEVKKMNIFQAFYHVLKAWLSI